MRKAHRFAIVAAAILTAGVTAVAVSPKAGAGQYEEYATSGSGTNTGTAAEFWTWNNWAVPENPSHHCTNTTGGYCWYTGKYGDTYGEGFTAESVFLENTSNALNALEAGFGSGWAAGTNGGWTNAMQPYYTTNNGNNEVNSGSSFDLPSGTQIWVQAQNDGWIQVGAWQVDVNYSVSEPRKNEAQYETAYGDDWMGGGGQSGALHMYYQPASEYPNGWSVWGQISTNYSNVSDTHTPFGYSNENHIGGTNYEWEGWGYGNGVFGS